MYVKSSAAGVFVARPQPPARNAAPATTRAVCFDFGKGKCARGSDCKFLHTPPPSGVAVCTHCSKKGHAADMCFAKYPEKRPVKAKAGPGVPPKYPSSRSKAATNLLLTLRKNVNDLLSAEDEDATLVEDETAQAFTLTAFSHDEFPPSPKSFGTEDSWLPWGFRPETCCSQNPATRSPLEIFA